MTEFEKVLMDRDGDTREEAEKHKNEAMAMLYDILDNGGGYDDVEDMMISEYGLEMDYVMDLI